MDIDLDDVDLPTTKEKGKRVSKKKIVYAKILAKQRKKFIAFLEEDSDHNSVVWSAFTDSRSSLPKKGDLVVYFPQGHLEYVGHLEYEQPPKAVVRTYDLQPQIICRVEHVQLMIMEAEDDIYANITLHPEPEVNSEEKELEQLDEIEDCIYDEDGRPAPVSTPSFFSKILGYSDIRSSLSIPPKAAKEFFCLDNESMDLQNEVIAKDFHGNEWKFPLIRDKEKGNWLLGLSEIARARNLLSGDKVVFLREKDTKLRFGIRKKNFRSTYLRRNVNPLLAAAGAIFSFSVMYEPKSGDHEDFVIPYQKYMKSITRPGLIGAKFHKQKRIFNSFERYTGVVTAMTDLDPMNWPNSKWKCLTVSWKFWGGEDPRVSPWEIVFDDSDEAIRSKKQKHVQEPIPIHYEAYTTNHPFDIQKQTPALQTTNYKELKISNCSVDDLWRHLKENHSYEYLEFDSCSFPSSTRIPTPITIKKLKITNCVDTEQVFTVLMDPNLSVESLEIDSCSSFNSMSTGGIPATLRQLKIVNCMNLNSLSESFETEKSPSIDERVHYSKAEILELRKLEIQNCQKLESLPKGMHKLRNLDLLSINDCCSLEYFPEGGFPITCLTSLSISGCENLKCLPNKLHKVTSLQNLSISGCPSLMFFPEGGLPPNLVSLRIIDCESLFSISQWELHKLKHLREYSFSCGCSDSGE